MDATEAQVPTIFCPACKRKLGTIILDFPFWICPNCNYCKVPPWPEADEPFQDAVPKEVIALDSPDGTSPALPQTARARA